MALINPFAHLKAAASGDLDTLRALADHAVELVHFGCIDPERTLLEGLIFARLAAAAGDAADKGRVLSMLALIGSYASTPFAEADYFAEGVAMTSILADMGEEIAAEGINQLAEHTTPEVLELAKAYELVLKEAY